MERYSLRSDQPLLVSFPSHMLVLRRLPFLALAVLVLAACEDPTNVGIGLIGDRGGEPLVEVRDPSTLQSVDSAPVTGNSDQTLVGQVIDPLLGSIQANAYVDFNAPIAAGGFREGVADYAALELQRSYVFGDTTGTFTISLFEMEDEWSAQGSRADTTLPHGDLISSYTLSAADSIISLPLPSDWVAENDTTLRSASFATVFHGFYLEATSGEAVIGFASSGTNLVAAAGTDTVRYTMARNLTTTTRAEATETPEHLTLVQAAAGPALEVSYDLQDLRDDGHSLNRATLRVQVDTLASTEGLPPNFVRPVTERLNLYMRRADGTALLVETATRNQNEFAFGSTDFQTLMDQFILGAIEIEAFELRAPSSPNTLNHVLVRADENNRPRLTLTVTPLLD